MYELVVFDCDGVLVDSEVLVTQIESEMLAELGAVISAAEIARNFTGLSDAVMNEVLRRDWNVELPATFDADRATRVADAFEDRLVAIPGIATVLAGLTTPCCVASSSAPDRIRQSLTVTGLIDAFDGRLYSSTMVARGKPAPDLFEYAAAALGAVPDRCVVVEDSPHGVEAGRAAGMHVVGFTAGGHCPPDHADRLRAAGAHEVAATSLELARLLGPRD